MVNDSFFSQENFMPHGMCYLWRPDILWTSVISDVITALAYFSITIAVIVFVKKRRDLPYPWFFILSGSIIFVACGSSHLISAIVIWEPIYSISAIIKAITAITSLATGIVIWFLLPFFLKLPSPSMLEEKNAALELSLAKLKVAHTTIIESQRLASLTNLMAGMAHELNTPMGTSLTAASYLDHEVEKLKLQKITKSEFDKIIENIKQGLKLVLNNLTKSTNLVSIFKQVAVTESISEKQLLNVYEFSNDLTNALSLKLNLSQKQVTIDCPTSMQIRSNPNALIDIISNLFTNSVAHGFQSLAEGHITLSFEKTTEETLTFTYSDNGTGMEPEQVEKIFDPFFTTKRGKGGPGLGMTIVYNTIKNMDGTIECKSDAGKGSIFVIQLPVTYT